MSRIVIAMGLSLGIVGASVPAASAWPTRELSSTNRAWGVNVWTTAEVPAVTAAIGKSPRIVGIFRDWVHEPAFPTAEVSRIVAGGALPMIAWEPWDSWNPSTAQPAFSMAGIDAGKHDRLIDSWAVAAKAVGRPVLIRVMPEMNGDWRPWSLGRNGTTATNFKGAWRHIVDRFRAKGATNVKWVWNPYVEVGGSTPIGASFPGERYVDYTALDGYNWGSVREWGWQSYDDIFASSVRALKRIAPNRSWFMAEVATAPGALKNDWITSFFSRSRADGAVAIVWFEFDKETDWRLASPGSARTAARAIAAGGWRSGS